MKNKLGLYIERVQSGPTRLFGTNEDPSWTKKVWDLRNNGFISNINTGNSLNILMLSEIENGHIITIARCSTGRTDDYISAWIYVPCAIDITGKILVKIINIVQKEINATNLDKELLDELFSRAYDAAPAKKICSNSTSEQIAFRYYGAGTTEELYEILDAPCQSYYRNFKTILLFDKASAAICANATDLTTRDIERMVVVSQPHSVDGWTPYIKNEIFDTPIYMRVGDKVELEWRRKGYAPIPKSFIVADNAKADAPREKEYLSPEAIHTIEHLMAHYLRERLGNKVVSFAPMGCKTGFYLVVKGWTPQRKVMEAVLEVCRTQSNLKTQEDVPGLTVVQCGNPELYNIEESNAALAEYGDLLERLLKEQK
jgi:S-ribosylhomocysteine lyase